MYICEICLPIPAITSTLMSGHGWLIASLSVFSWLFMSRKSKLNSGSTLRWRHNERDSVSNHQPHDCLLIVYSDADQRNRQSSASLAFVWGIHRGPVNSPHKWPVTRKMFPFDDVIMKHPRCWGFGDEGARIQGTLRISTTRKFFILYLKLSYWQNDIVFFVNSNIEMIKII